MINCIITLSKWLWNHKLQVNGSIINFDDVMMKFIFNKRTDALKLTLICFYNNKTPKWSNAGNKCGEKMP